MNIGATGLGDGPQLGCQLMHVAGRVGGTVGMRRHTEHPRLMAREKFEEDETETLGLGDGEMVQVESLSSD